MLFSMQPQRARGVSAEYIEQRTDQLKRFKRWVTHEVMVICLVCSKYAQYFSRKSEIGILSALGYTRKEITTRTFLEVILTNVIGFIIGLALAIPLCKFVMAAAFDSIGGAGA